MNKQDSGHATGNSSNDNGENSAGKTEVAMRGGGYYSLSTAGAKDVIDAATLLVLDAVASVPVKDGLFTFSDMGCADGGTSLQMVARAVGAIQTDTGSVDFPQCF